MVISEGVIAATLIRELLPLSARYAGDFAQGRSGKCILKLVITDRPYYSQVKRVNFDEKEISGEGNFKISVFYSRKGEPRPNRPVVLRLIDARTEFNVKVYKRLTNSKGEAKFKFPLKAGIRYRIEAAARSLSCI